MKNLQNANSMINYMKFTNSPKLFIPTNANDSFWLNQSNDVIPQGDSQFHCRKKRRISELNHTFNNDLYRQMEEKEILKGVINKRHKCVSNVYRNQINSCLQEKIIELEDYMNRVI
jgi:hypothetical protein